MSTPDQFARIAGRVNLRMLADRRVLTIGVGSVGSAIARHLAHAGLGHQVLADGDVLELHNLIRHDAPAEFLGWNKAEAMTVHLSRNVPSLEVRAIPAHIDDRFSDRQIDELIAASDLVVIATDQRTPQRRIARRALALDVPAVVPGLYERGGGEVFVQLSPAQACFSCWDAFRPPDADVRGVHALGVDGLAVIQHAVYLCIGLLDPTCQHARLLAGTAANRQPRQLFTLTAPFNTASQAAVSKRPGCTACRVGPSPTTPLRPAPVATTRSPSAPTASATTVNREVRAQLPRPAPAAPSFGVDDLIGTIFGFVAAWFGASLALAIPMIWISHWIWDGAMGRPGYSFELWFWCSILAGAAIAFVKTISDR